jgi:hypothetical protein
MNPLFKKLVDNFTFGELLQTKTTNQVNNSNVIFVEKPENKAKDMYMIIRKGKVVGWGEL